MKPIEPAPAADFHSHLMPGVDDGARNLAEALEAIERMVGAGIGRICTTPHLRASETRDPARLERRLSELDEAWDRVSSAAGDRFSGLTLERGCEVCLDVGDPDFSDPRIRLAGTAFVLVEWRRLQIPPRKDEDILRRIRADGYVPVLAHPERYGGIRYDTEVAGRWRASGAYLQVNQGSLAGRYGREAQEVACKLLSYGWVDYLSSDFHARPHLKVYLAEARTFLLERSASEQLGLLTVTNPSRLLKGETPLPVPPLSRSGSGTGS